MEEGVEFIKKQLKRLESKLNSERKDYERWDNARLESEMKIRELKSQIKSLNELIGPYELTEKVDDVQTS